MAELEKLAVPGTEIPVRVTPGAPHDRIDCRNGTIRVHVRAVPENGKATDAARKVLAKALGIAPSRLTLIRGATSRQKVFGVR